MPSSQVWTGGANDQNFASSYDHMHAGWGSSYQELFQMFNECQFLGAFFIWTGFDYLGEPTPYGWPSRSSVFGIIDLAGMPKDIYYMFQAELTNATVLHVFPHWNWIENQTIDVWAYYNNADEVELFVNGVSQGKKSKPEGVYHVMWNVTFAPGSIRAVSRKGGVEVASKEIHTAGDPAKIVLIPDRDKLKGDGVDLSYITVEIRDKDDNLCPNATNLISFTVEGAGFIAGTDNGDENNSISLKTPERNAFFGKAMVAIQNNGKSGRITLRAKSANLPDVVAELTAE
jgi:beta-galactosidase